MFLVFLFGDWCLLVFQWFSVVLFDDVLSFCRYFLVVLSHIGKSKGRSVFQWHWICFFSGDFFSLASNMRLFWYLFPGLSSKS